MRPQPPVGVPSRERRRLDRPEKVAEPQSTFWAGDETATKYSVVSTIAPGYPLGELLRSSFAIWQGDALALLDRLPREPLFDLVVTSPPYNLGGRGRFPPFGGNSYWRT